MAENIELTPQELEDIKDDITFKTKTTIYLKQMTTDFKKHCDTSEKFRKKVDRLEVHRSIHWYLISIIIGAILWFKFVL